MNFVGSVTACLEKSFKKVLELRGKLIKSCSKYQDCLESNLTVVSEYQSLEEPNCMEAVVELPYGRMDGIYKN